jgi:hypothetical protein
MIHFRVEGPCKIKKSRKKHGYSIDKEAVRHFWTENEHIADEVEKTKVSGTFIRRR